MKMYITLGVNWTRILVKDGRRFVASYGLESQDEAVQQAMDSLRTGVVKQVTISSAMDS